MVNFFFTPLSKRLEQPATIDHYMKYPQMLDFEGAFRIEINNKVIFDEPVFPILEFIYFVSEWIEKTKRDMMYKSIETDDNPLITFTRINTKWKITSRWQKEICNDLVELNEIIDAYTNMKNQVMIGFNLYNKKR